MTIVSLFIQSYHLLIDPQYPNPCWLGMNAFAFTFTFKYHDFIKCFRNLLYSNLKSMILFFTLTEIYFQECISFLVFIFLNKKWNMWIFSYDSLWSLNEWNHFRVIWIYGPFHYFLSMNLLQYDFLIMYEWICTMEWIN